ncbi:MAG TPA: hypothetical protein VKY62_10555 [Devosia sp.]|nr:hypothetical protein [Devosia sp.]
MTDYKLMPVEPAADMLGNAMSVCIGFSGDYGTYNCYLSEDAAREVYQAFRAAAPAVQGEPVEFDYPDFHEQGMGCGLEDRNITDRYEAMRYGWDEALERVAENIGSLGPLYTFPQPTEQQPAPDVAGLVDWAVRKWHEQVANRPLVNVHRRTLDGVWRQVIRFAGEDDVVLLGPRHDDMLDASGNPLPEHSAHTAPCCGDPGDCWEPCGELGKSEAHVRVHSPDAAKMVPVPYELLCRLADEDFRSEVPDDWVPEMTGPDGSKGPATFTVGDLRAAADLVRAFEGGEA